MTIAQALAAAAASGLERLDAQLLLLHTLGRVETDRAWLLAHDTDVLEPMRHEEFMRLCERRTAGEPLAYIVGHKEFFGLDLRVDARVLVPRPETETLVEWALSVIPGSTRNPGLAGDHAPAWIAGQARDDSALASALASALDGPLDGSLDHPSIVDLGTGSGAIALAIKSRLPHVNVEAVDASADALAVARDNAASLSLDIHFRQASWLAESQTRYDLIMSNPPYVAQADPHLSVLTHEPLQALASGEDGLDDIRTIVRQAPAHLRPGGWLLLEHGWDQASAVRDLLVTAGFQKVASRCDLAGIERCSGGQWLELG